MGRTSRGSSPLLRIMAQWLCERQLCARTHTGATARPGAHGRLAWRGATG